MRWQRVMKIISLRRYPEQAGRSGGAAECASACLEFAEGVCAELGLEASAEEGAEGGRRALFARLLEQLRQWKRERELRQEQARLEMQWLLAAFNQAIMALAEGGDRAAGRFAAVGDALERAVRADSLVTMRAALHEATEVLRRESEAQRRETAEMVVALGRRLEEARRRSAEEAHAAGGCGRQEAVRALREAEAEGRTVVAAVAFDRLPALEARFGRAVAGEALGAFERERISPLARDGTVYAWGPAMRLWLMEPGDDAEQVRARLEAALAEPFEYHTWAAGRRVTLALEGRWMWGMLGRMDVEALIEEVDLFAAGAPIRR